MPSSLRNKKHVFFPRYFFLAKFLLSGIKTPGSLKTNMPVLRNKNINHLEQMLRRVPAEAFSSRQDLASSVCTADSDAFHCPMNKLHAGAPFSSTLRETRAIHTHHQYFDKSSSTFIKKRLRKHLTARKLHTKFPRQLRRCVPPGLRQAWSPSFLTLLRRWKTPIAPIPRPLPLAPCFCTTRPRQDHLGGENRSQDFHDITAGSSSKSWNQHYNFFVFSVCPLFLSCLLYEECHRPSYGMQSHTFIQ